MTTITDRTAALKAARAKDSNDKRRRVLQTMKTMETTGQPITAAAVATAAGVSTWLVYADGIREHLDAARTRSAKPSTAPHPPRPAPHRPPARHTRRPAHRPRRRSPRDPQATNRSRQTPGPTAVATRSRDRTTRPGRTHRTGRRAGNREPPILAERDARTSEADTAQRRVEQLEDELTAARESLRRVIRETNR